MNIALPEWATEQVRSKMEKLVALEYDILSYNTLMKRLNGGFIIKEFLKNLNKPGNTNAPKIYVYSGHELNIAAFAKAHDLTEPKLPAFGSAIVVEKLRNHSGVAHIQVSIKLYIMKYFLNSLYINYNVKTIHKYKIYCLFFFLYILNDNIKFAPFRCICGLELRNN